MGRFLNSRIKDERIASVHLEPVADGDRAGSEVASAIPADAPNVVHWFGLWVLALYSVAGFFNELILRVAGFNPRVGTIAGLALFGAFILSRGLSRSFSNRLAWLWWGLIIWMLVCVPFSTWRRGSLLLVWEYGIHSHVLFFFALAFLLNLKQCRVFMLATALGSYVLLLWCYLFGAMDPVSYRFTIPKSLFFGNANDLGIYIAISMGSLAYLLMQKSLFLRFFGLLGLPIAFFYLLKTGSRGAAIACAAFVVTAFFYSRGVAKMMVVVGLALVAAVAIVTIPSATLSRLTMVFLDPKEEVRAERVSSDMEMHSIASQIARSELIKLSLWYTITNPVFGVGPGEFIDRVGGDAAMKSKRSGWVGTHNAYTQVSSECGLPAAFLFLSVLWLVLRTAHRLLAQSRGHPELVMVNQLAFALLLTTVAFSVSALFHHIAYTSYLALLGGQALAYEHAARPLLARIQSGIA